MAKFPRRILRGSLIALVLCLFSSPRLANPMEREGRLYRTPNFQMFDGRHVSDWTAELRDKSEERRLQALNALDLLSFESDTGFVALTKELTKDASAKVRIRLYQLGGPRAKNYGLPDLFYDGLVDPSEEVRVAVLSIILQDQQWAISLSQNSNILAKLFDDKSSAVREHALLGLQKGNSLREVRHLVLRLEHDPNLNVRAAAIGCLAPVDDNEISLRKLRAYLGNPSATIRKGVAKSLGELRSAKAEATALVGKLLHDEDREVREQALTSHLSLAGLKQSSGVVFRWLHSADSRDRLTVCQILRSIDFPIFWFDKEVVEFLVEVARVDPVEEIRLLAAETLFLRRDTMRPELAPMLCQIVAHGESESTKRAARLLLDLDKSAILDRDALQESVRSGKPYSQIQAAKVLCYHSKDGELLDFLATFLSNPSFEVRIACAQSLLEMKPRVPRVFPYLILALRDSDPRVRRIGRSGLFFDSVRYGLSTAYFLAALENSDPFVRQVAISELNDVPGSDAKLISALRIMLIDPIPEIRVLAARKLWNSTRDSHVLPVLSQLAQHKQSSIRISAVEQLANMKKDSQPAVPQLRSCLKSTSGEERVVIAMAIWQITGDSSAWKEEFHSPSILSRRKSIQNVLKFTNERDSLREELLSIGLSDADPAIRREALRQISVGNGWSRNLARVVTNKLTDTDCSVQKDAALTIEKCRELPVDIYDTIPKLIRLLQSTDLETASIAFRLLISFEHFTADVTDALCEFDCRNADDLELLFNLDEREFPHPPRFREKAIALSRSDQVSVRRLATTYLWSVNDPDDCILAALESLLCDPEEDIRSMAASAIGEKPPLSAKAERRLFEIVRNDGTSASTRAIYALAGAGTSVHSRLLIEIERKLASPDLVVQTVMAEALVRIGEPAKKFVPQLRRFANSPDGQLSEAAKRALVSILHSFEPIRSEQYVVRALESLDSKLEKFPWFRPAAIAFLEQFVMRVSGGEWSHAHAFLKELSPESPVLLASLKMRANTRELWGSFDALETLLQERPEEVRKLNWQKMLGDPSEDRQMLAARALWELEGRTDGVKVLLAMLGDTKRYRRSARGSQIHQLGEQFYCLARFGAEGREAVPILTAMLADSNPEDIRLQAIRALGVIGSDAKSAVPALVKIMKQQHDKSIEHDIPIEAALALWRIEKQEAAFERILTDLREFRLESGAIDALEQVGRDALSALPELRIALHCRQPRCRKRVAALIAKLEEASPVRGER